MAPAPPCPAGIGARKAPPLCDPYRKEEAQVRVRVRVKVRVEVRVEVRVRFRVRGLEG